MRRAAFFGIAAAVFVAPLALAAQPDLDRCPAVALPPIALNNVQKTLKQNKELIIVALGSSSTEGARSSDLGHSYPAVLQRELSNAMPEAHIAVINRGIGGQDAAEELARMDKDVLSLSPALVIWQVGANGAMKGNDPDAFKLMVDRGVRRIELAGSDVVLMDNQRSPKILGSPVHAKLDQALADVATLDNARLFARGRLMELWQDAGYPYGEFLADDGVHHNDRGYTCMARALANSILHGLGRVDGQQAQASK